MSTAPGSFQETLSLELVRADLVRTQLVSALMFAGAAFGLFIVPTVPERLLREGFSRASLYNLLLVGLIAGLGELLIALQIRKVLQGRATALRWGAWALVTVEALLPTALLYLLSTYLSDENVLASPLVMLYALILVPTSLRLDPRYSLYAGGLCAASYLALAVGLIERGLVIPPSNSGITTFVTRAFYLLLAGGAAAFVASQLRLRFQHSAEAVEQRNWVVGVFGRYLSDDIVAVLINDPNGLKLGGEKNNVTLLMTDLRGFSNISERMEPAKVVELLNHYLGAMTAVIGRNGGTIDEFIGDAILVIWNAPLRQQDHAARAVRCALEMQREMTAVNAWNRERGFPEIEMGVGIHSGDVVVGNIGSPQRQKYGVVGATVNLTARVESYTVGGQILITAATAAQIEAGLEVADTREVYPKGATEAVKLLDVVGLGDLKLPHSESALQPIPPLEVSFRLLLGKDLSPDLHAGALVALSAREADLRCDTPLKAWQNLAISLGGGTAFAKVMAVGGTARLRFTSVDEAAAAARDRALPPG